MRNPPATDPEKGFWQGLSPNLDAAPFSPSGKFSIPLLAVMATPPLNPDGRVDGRGVNQPVGEAPGRWSNCRVYLDVPQSFAADNSVLFTLWADTQGVSTIVAEAPVSAMGLELYQTGSPVPRLRGVGLGGSGMPGISWRVTARSKTDFVAFVGDPTIGGPTWPLGTVALEVWGTESPLGLVQGAPGASLAAGGFKDNAVTAYASELLGWNAAGGVWLPVAVDTSGNLVTSTASTLGAVIPAIAPTAGDAFTPSRAVSSTGGNLFKGTAGVPLSVVATNGTAVAGFYLVFNTLAPPAVADIPVYAIAVAAKGTGKLSRSDFADYGSPFDRGIGGAWSSTAAALTVVGAPAGDVLATVLYK